MKLLAPVLACMALLAPHGAAAQPAAYPHKVVTLITHSSPGGGSDVFLREMVKHLGKYIGATFIVDNVSGGNFGKYSVAIIPIEEIVSTVARGKVRDK